MPFADLWAIFMDSNLRWFFLASLHWRALIVTQREWGPQLCCVNLSDTLSWTKRHYGWVWLIKCKSRYSVSQSGTGAAHGRRCRWECHRGRGTGTGGRTEQNRAQAFRWKAWADTLRPKADAWIRNVQAWAPEGSLEANPLWRKCQPGWGSPVCAGLDTGRGWWRWWAAVVEAAVVPDLDRAASLRVNP